MESQHLVWAFTVKPQNRETIEAIEKYFADSGCVCETESHNTVTARIPCKDYHHAKDMLLVHKGKLLNYCTDFHDTVVLYVVPISTPDTIKRSEERELLHSYEHVKVVDILFNMPTLQVIGPTLTHDQKTVLQRITDHFQHDLHGELYSTWIPIHADVKHICPEHLGVSITIFGCPEHIADDWLNSFFDSICDMDYEILDPDSELYE